VTAKYEAWPDLWMSLAEREIPLAIVGARARRSLRLGKWLCTAMGARLPEMRLLAAGPEDAAGLAALFPEARVSVTGEPRWDRVLERSSKGNPRARELVARLRSLPRPWGVLGSAWIEDLDAFRGCLGAIPGTLWTVPHKIDDAHVVPLVQRLSAAGWAPFLTSRENEPAGGGRAAPVVDEVGFLSELYSSADWAYVGGGFGAISVHSTIEPAITGIPIACGARGTWKFPETAELASSGQLTIVRSAQELEAWVASLPGRIVPGLRESYRAQALARGGATERVLAELLSEGRGAC
jgi:3-deoxy-D-manno-octulosonic-acid transferase